MRVLILLAALLLASCAKEMPPPGGPPDKTPPEILATTPAPGATLVDRSAPINIEFSERINGKAIGNALFISPPLKVEPTVKVKGARLQIEPSEPLDSGRTYVVTIGASLTDLQGNRLTSSKTIAFSTGAQIDSGIIVGHVFDKQKPQPNFRIFAYENDSTLIDSLFVRIPDYITESGTDGSFAFANMKEADYLVIGVEDKDRDNLISRESERIALPYRVVTACPPDVKSFALDLHVSRHDSTELSVINCIEDDGTIVLQFAGQKLDPKTLELSAIQFSDSVGNTIAPDAAMIFTAEPERVYLWASNLAKDTDYTVRLRSLRGEEGKRLAGDTCSCRFRYRGVDEQAPLVKERIPGGSTSTIYPGDSLRILFSEPVVIGDSAFLFAIDSTHSTRGRLGQIPGTTAFYLQAESTLPFDRPMKTALRLANVADRSGHPGRDTIYTFSISLASPDSLGSLSGSIETPLNAEVDVRFIGVNRKREYQLRHRVAGAFTLKMYPDLYHIIAFEDRNANNRWDIGALRPFSFAERGWIVSDSIRVRARFDHEDFKLKLE